MNIKNLLIGILAIILLIVSGCTDKVEAPTIPPTIILEQTPTVVTQEPMPTVVVTQESQQPEPTETETLFVTEGIFTYIEWGDYLHLYMMDIEKNELSFFVLKYPDFDVELLKEGQKIKAYWRNVDIFLDAPQAIINLNELVKIEIIN